MKGHTTRVLADMGDTLTVQQTAMVLNRSPWAIYKAIRRGEIRTIALSDRKRTIPKSEVERLLAGA